MIAAKVHGVTPDYIRKLRKGGFKDVTLNDIIAMKRAGIFD